MRAAARPLLFALASLALLFALFHRSMSGETLLAPLDIAPALFPKYQFVDPTSNHIPANQYVVDQLIYDLPLQHTIHQACRAGEMPWWDPYTYGGRPLLADAHINGTDPVRLLCYRLLPFELAYNWTLILHSFLSGLGMFFLLRFLQFEVTVSTLLALAYQFAGCQAMYFGHPWIQASFIYYPFLWITWTAASNNSGWQRSIPAIACGSLLSALVFVSGNLQSHIYVVCFAAVFCLGYCGVNSPAWRKALPVVALSGVLGAALAAPVLLPQLEFFRLSLRAVFEPFYPITALSGVFSLSAFFPWALGTFRTLDLSKVIGGRNLGFHLYLGSAAFVLAGLGAFRFAPPLKTARRIALGLIFFYIAVCSTPLEKVLYTRCAGLGVMGLTVLAAIGWQWLVAQRESFRSGARALVLLTAVTVVALNVGAFVVYPRFVPKIRAIMENAPDQFGLEAAALRNFQLHSMADEISWRNPETIFAFVSLLLLAAMLARPTWRTARFAGPVLLVVNLLPVLLFYSRFVPQQPAGLWQALLAGGPEQKRVAEILGDEHRLVEVEPTQKRSGFEKLFPDDFGHFYKVHTVHGYSALQPRSLAFQPSNAPAGLLADYSFTCLEPGLPTGHLERLTKDHLARFTFENQMGRSVHIAEETLDTVRVTFTPGTAATLIRSDTFYPGWRAFSGSREIPIRAEAPCFSALDVLAGESSVTFRYEPTGWRTGLFLCGGSLLIIVSGLALVSLRRNSRP